MKKFIIVFITLILTFTLSACSAKASTNPDENSTIEESTLLTPEVDVTSDENEIDISIFPEVKPSSENLNIYRNEVSKRISSLGEKDSFFSNEEWSVISKSTWLNGEKYRHKSYISKYSSLYDEITKYYLPVVFRDGNLLIMWYTTESGSVLFEKVDGVGSIRGGNYGGELHHDTSSEEIISSTVTKTVTYTQETGKVKVYQFGKIVDEFSVLENSIYCGFSSFEGYIFRNGTDIYSLKAIDTYGGDGTVVSIAHNVKYVIDADYYFGSDPWCQPLFLMEDGSIKCYIGWNGDKDAAPDDISHLCDLQYEGSYDK